MTQTQETCDEIIAALPMPLSWYFACEITQHGLSAIYRVSLVTTSNGRKSVFEGTFAEASALQTELLRILRVHRRLTA